MSRSPEQENPGYNSFGELPTDPQRLQKMLDETGNILQQLEEQIRLTQHFASDNAITFGIMQAQGEAGFSAVSAQLAQLSGDEEGYKEGIQYASLMLGVIDLARDGDYEPLKTFIAKTADAQFDLARRVVDRPTSESLQELGNKYNELNTAIPPYRPNN